MQLPPPAKRRKSTRLRGYDYSGVGSYFITICAAKRAHIFGRVNSAANTVELTELGKIANAELPLVPSHYDAVTLDCHIVMPNHVHAIITINEKTDKKALLDNIVGGYKSAVWRKCKAYIWQRSYHDHVIRNTREYAFISEYIEYNPARWAEDKYSGLKNENCEVRHE